MTHSACLFLQCSLWIMNISIFSLHLWASCCTWQLLWWWKNNSMCILSWTEVKIGACSVQKGAQLPSKVLLRFCCHFCVFCWHKNDEKLEFNRDAAMQVNQLHGYIVFLLTSPFKASSCMFLDFMHLQTCIGIVPFVYTHLHHTRNFMQI